MIEMLTHVIFALLFGYALYLGIIAIKKMYGGKFTTILPTMIGAIGLIFTMHASKLFLAFTSISMDNESLLVSFKILTIVAGYLILHSIYGIYQIGFATSGMIFKGGK